MRFQLLDGQGGKAQHIAVGGQDEFDVQLLAGLCQQVERVQVVCHVAIGRVDDGGAAVQDMVAREQQAVFDQHQAQVVGRMAGCVQHLQGVLGQLELLAMGQGPVRGELTAGVGRGG